MRILITGGNRGIGAAFVKVARGAGHDVIATSRPGKGGALQFDITDHAAVRAAAAGTGPIDCLINNAGIIGPDRQSTLDMDFEGFARTLAINTMAPLAVAQAFLPNLRQGRMPRILSISSQMSFMGYAKSTQIAYRASKAALNKVMQGLATDLAPEGIAVAVIDPGWVRTDMGGAKADLDAEPVAAGLLKIVETLTIEDTGKFLHWQGAERAY